jgi:hypothetical protein
MKKKLIIMSLLVFLLTGLSTSSFFLNKYLTESINKNTHSTEQLNFALEQENLAALRLAWQQAQFHSEQWLVLAKKLAKTQGEVAYQLAVYYQKNPIKSIFWYKRAIRLDYLEASIALAKLYFQQENLGKATKVLSAMPRKLSQTLDVKANLLKVNIAIHQGRVNDVKKLVDKYYQRLQKTAAGRLLLNDIKKYQLLTNEKQNSVLHSTMMNCDNSIQLFATNLKHLKYLETLISNFKSQALNHAVCFSTVRYIPINALDCNGEQNIAIRCNELSWQPWASSINSRYVGFMLPKGGANVHLGVLYFDTQDSVDVVAHEISHLLGFIDEYPLIPEHVKCQASQFEPFSQNISILKKRYQGERNAVRNRVLKQLAWAKQIKQSTPILQPVLSLNDMTYWQLGTPEEFKDQVGLFNAKTCDNSASQDKNSFAAFKPVFHRTKLQYFALNFPQLYSVLLQVNPKQYLMPSFHYNFALAYFQQDNIEQANYWLEQAANWESDLKRRKKIRQGGF